VHARVRCLHGSSAWPGASLTFRTLWTLCRWMGETCTHEQKSLKTAFLLSFLLGNMYGVVGSRGWRLTALSSERLWLLLAHTRARL
jgi:hypothetical protein